MNTFIVSLYNKIPPSLKQRLGQSSRLKWLRKLVFQSNNNYRTVTVQVNKTYAGQKVSFWFRSVIKIAARAQNRGIENTLLNNSIVLINGKGLIEDAVVFDIGANFGYLSLVWSQTIAKSGQVHAFEANKWVSDCLTASIEANNLQSNVIVVNNAVGDTCKSVQLYLNSSSSNVLDINDIEDSVTVNMITIDSYVEKEQLSRCDLIKIDVDGIEPAILEGAKDTILKFKPIVIVETNNHMEMIVWFENLNYDIFDMKLEPYIKGNMLPPNIFCVPKAAQ